MKEHQRREWKKSCRGKFMKWTCSFANAEDGVLVIGRNLYPTPSQLEAMASKDEARRIFGKRFGESVGKPITNSQYCISLLLAQGNRMSSHKLAEQVGISNREIEKNIAKLNAPGHFRWIGSATSRHCEVLK